MLVYVGLATFVVLILVAFVSSTLEISGSLERGSFAVGGFVSLLLFGLTICGLVFWFYFVIWMPPWD